MLTKRDLLLRSAALAAITAATMKPPRRAHKPTSAPRGPRHRQGGLHLRLPDRGQLPHPARLLGGSREPGIQGGWNQIWNIAARLHARGHGDPTPNSDTPYSIGVDLRAEPMVLTVPAIEKARYFTSSSSTTTPSTSTTSAPARPAMAAAASCSPGRLERGDPQGHR